MRALADMLERHPEALLRGRSGVPPPDDLASDNYRVSIQISTVPRLGFGS